MRPLGKSGSHWTMRRIASWIYGPHYNARVVRGRLPNLSGMITLYPRTRSELAQDKQDESVGCLMSDAFRIPVEQRVSATLGRTWRVINVQDMSDMSSHPAAILSDESYAVFVKLYEGDVARDQLKLE